MRLLPLIAVSALSFAACVPLDSSIEVENRSSFEIHEIYVTPVNAGSWGDNLLGPHEIVMPGDTVNVHVHLMQPIAMEVGQRFAIREGGKTVGAGKVLKIDT